MSQELRVLQLSPQQASILIITAGASVSPEPRLLHYLQPLLKPQSDLARKSSNHKFSLFCNIDSSFQKYLPHPGSIFSKYLKLKYWIWHCSFNNWRNFCCNNFWNFWHLAKRHCWLALFSFGTPRVSMRITRIRVTWPLALNITSIGKPRDRCLAGTRGSPPEQNHLSAILSNPIKLNTRFYAIWLSWASLYQNPLFKARFR